MNKSDQIVVNHSVVTNYPRGKIVTSDEHRQPKPIVASAGFAEEQEPEMAAGSHTPADRIAVDQRYRRVAIENMAARSLGPDEQAAGMAPPDLVSVFGRAS